MIKHQSKSVFHIWIRSFTVMLGILLLTACAPGKKLNRTQSKPILLKAEHVFDGHNLLTNTAVLIKDGVIDNIGPFETINTDENTNVIDLGNATLLPGFIELHAHLTYKNIPATTVLEHGITTLRDLGGPVHQPKGGVGTLRVLTSGPIITAPEGYPIPVLGNHNIAIPVSTEQQARDAVKDLVSKGAVIIKIALEPGGEAGAPWSNSHQHGHQMAQHSTHSSHQTDHHSSHHHKKVESNSSGHWPLLSENIVKAIVDEAHQHQRKVSAHIGETRGARIAINAGVDEWSHIPCDAIPYPLLKKAVEQQVSFVSTLDTLSKCSGIKHNMTTLQALGARFYYGAEIAHPDIPRGIDAQEMNYLKQYTAADSIDILRMVTSTAGKYLNYPLLGTLKKNAPADIIAVKQNPIDNFKSLEYPDLVISGGKVVINRFNQ